MSRRALLGGLAVASIGAVAGFQALRSFRRGSFDRTLSSIAQRGAFESLAGQRVQIGPYVYRMNHERIFLESDFNVATSDPHHGIFFVSEGNTLRPVLLPDATTLQVPYIEDFDFGNGVSFPRLLTGTARTPLLVSAKHVREAEPIPARTFGSVVVLFEEEIAVQAAHYRALDEAAFAPETRPFAAYYNKMVRYMLTRAPSATERASVLRRGILCHENAHAVQNFYIPPALLVVSLYFGGYFDYPTGMFLMENLADLAAAKELLARSNADEATQCLVGLAKAHIYNQWIRNKETANGNLGNHAYWVLPTLLLKHGTFLGEGEFRLNTEKLKQDISAAAAVLKKYANKLGEEYELICALGLEQKGILRAHEDCADYVRNKVAQIQAQAQRQGRVAPIDLATYAAWEEIITLEISDGAKMLLAERFQRYMANAEQEVLQALGMQAQNYAELKRALALLAKQ